MDTRLRQGDIFFSRRDPATGNWSANQKVNDDTSGGTQYYAAIALDGGNNAYAVWVDPRQGTIKNPDPNIFFSRRSAATGLWSANAHVNDDSSGRATQYAPRIAARSTGDAVAVWTDFRSNQWNVYWSRLAAGGSTWAANLRVSDNTVSRKFTPDVAVGADGTAYAVWEDDRSGNSDVWFSKLPPGASVWTANVKISDDPGTAAQYAPRIDIDAAGNLMVVWLDDRVPSTQVRMTRLLAGSQTWEASRLVSDTAAVPVALALGVSSGGSAFAVWQDARGTSYDIWGADYDSATNTWATPALISDDPAASAQMRPTVARNATEVAAAWRDDRVTGGDIRSRRRVTSIGSDHFTYAYDGLNRLTSLGGSAAEVFVFDAGSNLASRTGPSATYTYDTSNRLTGDGTSALVWSPADRTLQYGADNFSYDALGRLMSATIGGSTRGSVYDGDGRLASQMGVAQLWDVAVAPVTLVQSGPDRIVYGLGPLYGVRPDSTTYTFARDGLGSVRAELTSAPAVSKSFRYAAYGVAVMSVGGSPTLLGYAGELRDASGLIYLRSRWYDPRVGRFLTIDPVSGAPDAPGSLNRYTYASGNPISRTDPTGLCTGGGQIIYCIERWIPMPIACPTFGPFCGTGDTRWWPLPYAGTYREQVLVEADGHVRTTAGYTQLTFRNGDPVWFTKPELGTSNCDSAFGGSIVVSCVAVSGLGQGGPRPGPITTRVEILFSEGRPVVYASGTYFPSLAVYQYGAEGANLLYFYDGKAAGLAGLDTQGLLPNMFGGK